VLDLIAQAESRNNPQVMFPNQVIPNLTEKTIQEVLALQQERVTELRLSSSAAGKYQIIQATLSGLVNNGAIGLDDKFSINTQDRAGLALINEKGFQPYSQGRISPDQFATNLASIFAALPGPNNRTMLPAGGLNRALVTREQVMNVLGARYGGVLSGPASGYRATLHGTEAVIPLSGGRSIPVEMPGFTDGLRKLSEVMNAQTNKLDDLIEMMRVGNTISKDMLRYQRA